LELAQDVEIAVSQPFIYFSTVIFQTFAAVSWGSRTASGDINNLEGAFCARVKHIINTRTKSPAINNTKNISSGCKVS